MPDRIIRVALVAGPMYDRLYESLPSFESASGVQVEIAYRSPHAELNAHLSSLHNDIPYDLISTHTKYAPSQVRFLAPLDSVADRLDTASFYPELINLATINGHLFGIPRNIDVKLLHYRSDLVASAPSTWDELVATARALSNGADRYGFVFPGMESGLFGMFYELAEMGGARLFPASKSPLLDNAGGTWALGIIRGLYRSGAVPAEIVDWQYDEAHRCFLDGQAAMICNWPGYYGAYRNPDVSRVHNCFALARMPAGPTGVHKAYAGSHTFALTRRGIENPTAVELLHFLTAPAQQMLEAQQGVVPTRPAVLRDAIAQADAFTAERWRLLDCVIANDMLIPPGLSYYPEIEDILWRTVRAAMTESISVGEALRSMEQRIAQSHARYE